MGFSGHIKVMVLTGAVASVVSIQTSGAFWVGKLVVVVLCICKEHLEAIPVLLFVYRAGVDTVSINMCGISCNIQD